VLPALANEPDWYRRATVIHELFHLLTWPLGLLAEEADPVMGGRIFEATAGLVEYWAIWGLICSL
jgi:hypothetical protein